MHGRDRLSGGIRPGGDRSVIEFDHVPGLMDAQSDSRKHGPSEEDLVKVSFAHSFLHLSIFEKSLFPPDVQGDLSDTWLG